MVTAMRRKMRQRPIDFEVNSFRTVRVQAISSNTDTQINAPLEEDEMKAGCRLGIDSHADTSCINKHAYVEHVVDGVTVDAIPFDDSLGKASNLHIVHAIYAIDNPVTFRTHLIRINNGIYIPTMKQALLCPNQARQFGTIIDDIPPELDHTGTSSFSMSVADHNETSFPLQRHGPTAYLPVRRPTQEELDTIEIIDITEEEEWNPYDGFNYAINNVNIEQSRCALEEEEGTDDPISEHFLYSTPRRISALKISKPKSKLTPEYLAEIWNCGKETARKTLEATTCKHYRAVKKGLTRRFKPTRNFMRYRQITLPAGEFYTDTFKAKVRSVRGYTCAQIYGNKFGYLKSYPMESNNQQDVGNTLSVLIQDVGIMQKLHTDNAPEMVGRRTPFFKRARKEEIDLTTIEPERPDENYGETLVRIAKLGAARQMAKKRVPMRLWCYAVEHYSNLHSLTVPGMYRNKGRTGNEMVYGSTPDISEYVEFQFYDYCFYWDTPQSFPNEKKHMGRWLGIAHRVGQSMVFWIMNDKGKVIARSTVIPLDPSDYDVDENKLRMEALDIAIKERIGDYRNAINEGVKDIPDLSDEELDKQLEFCFDITTEELIGEDTPAIHDKRPDVDDGGNDVESEAFDKFLGISVEIPGDDGESMVLGKVKGRKRDHDGELIGRSNPNPILNTAVYNVETPDGNIHEYTANIIAEHLWEQVDDDGWDYGILHEIIGHRRKEDAIPTEQGFVETKSGNRKRVVTTKGWDIQVKWENGETTWVPLKIIKESNAAEVAEYAIEKGIQNEPAFAWWARTAIKQRDAVINKVCKRVRKRTKFGITIPETYEDAVALDRANGNTMWQDAIKKEMKNVAVAFKFLDNDDEIPIGFKSIQCHIVYDVKFDLTRKARYVGGGHRTKVPASMTYSSVVSRDSVRIMFLIAALNDLDIQMCDIGNAYLNAETRERLWFRAGPEWGSKWGCPVIIIRALYGLKSSGAEWKKTFSSYIRHSLGYEPCVGADDNVYIKPMKDRDGNEYYSYLIVYVDDVLCIDKDPGRILSMINRDYRLKEPPSPPKMYLGADFSSYDVTLENGQTVNCWAMSADSHIKKALQVIKERMNKDGVRFKSKKVADQPFTSVDYRPELDTTEYCNDEQVQFYQSLIGIARWLCELGRLDILTETSMLSAFLAAPRLGHLHQAMYMYKYLEDHKRSKIVFDPTYVNINDDHVVPEERASFRAKYMKELYPDAVEDLPPNAPIPRGKPVQVSLFVDADHAGDKMTRRSRTGVLIYLNSAPIMWLSRKQNTAEVSTYASEFVAMRQAMEMIKALNYKLRMFGIPILERAKIFGDNRSVILNSSVPESTLKKKHHSINYNYVRECVAAGIALIFKVDTGENLADLFTKVLDANKRKKHVQTILR